jgi:cytochrome bd-type quinol oxidase subunit 1
MKFITEEQKEKIKKFFNRFMNITIVVTTLVAGFGLGYYFQELKRQPKAVNETILNKEVRIAIDSEDKLIIMDRKSGQYVIYSDSIGKVIFKMYAGKIMQPQIQQ